MIKKTVSCLTLALALVAGFNTFSPLTVRADGDLPTLNSMKGLTKIYTAAETKEFIQLAKDTLANLAAGKQTEMVAKLTDLETAWDDKESMLRPKSETTWTLLDKTLDKAISALRSSHTDPAKGKAALEKLVKLLGDVTQPEAAK